MITDCSTYILLPNPYHYLISPRSQEHSHGDVVPKLALLTHVLDVDLVRPGLEGLPHQAAAI